MNPTAVIDIGSGTIKAGLAENEYPTCRIPTEIEESHPIQHGIIQDFDQVEKLIGQALQELSIDSTDHPVLLTQPPKNPQRDKEKLAEILFEKFHTPGLYVEVHPVLTFYASGRQAGLIVESGHGVTTVVPILSGYAISEAILRLDVGGGDVDQYLAAMINEKGDVNLTPKQTKPIKEHLCYVPSSNPQNRHHESYFLPDGTQLSLDKELQQATDPLFNPALVEQYDTPGIHEMIFQSIFKCGFDLRRDFASNIILSGGNTLIKGLVSRLQEELESRVPQTMKINIVEEPDRDILVWKGGSILGGLSTFYNICVSKAEYEEMGAKIIRKKFTNAL